MAERLGRWMCRLGRELIRGATLIGASMFCGGEVAPLLADRRSGAAETRRAPRPLSEAQVRGAASAGLREIERYLAAHDRLRP